MLNLERVRLQQAVAVARGLIVAMSEGPIHRSYFDAIALDPSEADELEFQTNAARAQAQAIARHRPA